MNAAEGDWPHVPAGALAEIRRELGKLYSELDQAVATAGPICELSGRCCRFREHGHTLFLSAPEAVLLLADAPPPARPLDDGATCPWQDARGHCLARAARPVGCRVYYCDPAFGDKISQLSEQFLTRLKELVRRYGWPWNYAPLHRHLRAAWDTARESHDNAALPLGEKAPESSSRSLFS